MLQRESAVSILFVWFWGPMELGALGLGEGESWRESIPGGVPCEKKGSEVGPTTEFVLEQGLQVYALEVPNVLHPQQGTVHCTK